MTAAVQPTTSATADQPSTQTTAVHMTTSATANQPSTQTTAVHTTALAAAPSTPSFPDLPILPPFAVEPSSVVQPSTSVQPLSNSYFQPIESPMSPDAEPATESFNNQIYLLTAGPQPTTVEAGTSTHDDAAPPEDDDDGLNLSNSNFRSIAGATCSREGHVIEYMSSGNYNAICNSSCEHTVLMQNFVLGSDLLHFPVKKEVPENSEHKVLWMSKRGSRLAVLLDGARRPFWLILPEHWRGFFSESMLQLFNIMPNKRLYLARWFGRKSYHFVRRKF